MGSKQLAVIAVIIILAVGGWLVFGKDKNNNSTTSGYGASSTSTTTDNNSSSSSTTSPTATDKVSIANMAFSPSNITVKKGTTVTWTNQDSIAHTVTETDGKTGPGSGSLDNGKTYSFTYNETGSFAYHCSIHPQMTGTVTVTE